MNPVEYADDRNTVLVWRYQDGQPNEIRFQSGLAATEAMLAIMEADIRHELDYIATLDQATAESKL